MRFVCSMIIFSSSAISARGIFCSKSRTYFNPTNCAAFSLSSATQCEKLAASATLSTVYVHAHLLVGVQLRHGCHTVRVISACTAGEVLPTWHSTNQ